MGSFANGLFTVLLGWFRGVVAWLWQIFSGEGSGFLGWVAVHWFTLLLLLCLVGTVLDLSVYLIRWRPWWVWQSFFRRRRIRRGLPEDDPSPKWVFADGTSRSAANAPVEDASYLPPPTEKEIAHLSYQSIGEAPAEAAEAPEPETKPGLRDKLRRFWTEDENEDILVYESEKTNMDFAYRDPYIPPQWKKPGDSASQEDV